MLSINHSQKYAVQWKKFFLLFAFHSISSLFFSFFSLARASVCEHSNLSFSLFVLLSFCKWKHTLLICFSFDLLCFRRRREQHKLCHLWWCLTQNFTATQYCSITSTLGVVCMYRLMAEGSHQWMEFYRYIPRECAVLCFGLNECAAHEKENRVICVLGAHGEWQIN